MEGEKKAKYEAWNEHLKHTKQLTHYSTQRLDLLLIAICGSGIYIVFESLKAIKSETLGLENLLLLKAARFFCILFSAMEKSMRIFFLRRNQTTSYEASGSKNAFNRKLLFQLR